MERWSQFYACLACLFIVHSHEAHESGRKFTQKLCLITCSFDIQKVEGAIHIVRAGYSHEDKCFKSTCDNGTGIFNAVAVLDCGHPRICSLAKVCMQHCWQYQATSVQNSTTAVCIAPSNETVAQATLTLLEFFGWRRALALTDSTTPRPSYNEFVNSSGSSDINITVVGINSSSSNYWSTTFNTEENQYRIFVLLHVDRNTTLRALCDAHRVGVFYPGYALINVGGDLDNLMNINNTVVSENCTLANIKTVLNYSLAIESPVTLNNTMGWKDSALLDAVKTIAEALQTDSVECTREGVSSIGGSAGGAEQDSQSLPKKVLDLVAVSFNGFTGNVSFEEDGSRSGTVALVVQYRLNLEKYAVAQIGKSGHNYSIVYVNGENETTIWPDGVPPDGRSIRVLDATHIATFIVFTSLFGVLLVFAICCVLINIIFRKRQVVKSTSPGLNNTMVLGVVFLGTGVIFYNTPLYSTDQVIPICLCRSATVVFGHDIPFGIALMKLFRIHHNFRNPKPNKKAIKDWHLLSALGLILSVEAVAFILLQTIAFTVTIESGEEVNKENPVTVNAFGIREEHYTIVCGKPIPCIVLVLFAVMIKFAMRFVAIVLALRTRTIEFDTVNDAKEIQVTVYISTVLIIIVGIMLFTLEAYPNAYGIGIGSCIYLECVTFLGFSFIPKMVVLWKDSSSSNDSNTDTAIQLSSTSQLSGRQLHTNTLPHVTSTPAVLQSSTQISKPTIPHCTSTPAV